MNPEKVTAGKSASEVFEFACHETTSLTKEISDHFWKRLGQMINEKLPKATTAPPQETIDDHRSRIIGKIIMTVGIHKGKRIDDVPVDYLEWVADNWDDPRGDQVRQYLESPRIKSERRGD